LLDAQAKAQAAQGTATIFAGGRQFESDDIVIQPEIREAIGFWTRLEELGGQCEQTKARMRRLCEFPAVKEFQALASQDDDWREVTQALGPLAERLYATGHATTLQTRSPEELDPDKVCTVEVELDNAKVVGFAAALVVLLLVGLAQLFKPSREYGNDLPVYSSRQTPPTRQAVPLWYGTPLQPLVGSSTANS